MIDAERREGFGVEAEWDRSRKQQGRRTPATASKVVIISTGRVWPRRRAAAAELPDALHRKNAETLARRHMLDVSFLAITVAMALLVWCGTR